MEDCLDRAFGHTSLAVDAFFGVDVDHLLPFVKALDRANHNAIGVLAGETWLSNDVSHRTQTPEIVGDTSASSHPCLMAAASAVLFRSSVT